jgi:hypothetical protein
MISKALLGSINNIRKLQSGTSLSSLAPKYSSRRAQATVVKTWDISTSSTIHYIRNMIHGRTSFSQILHQFSKMMTEDLMAESKKNVQTCKDKGVKTSNKSSKRKANISDGNEASTQYTREPISLLETDIVKFMTNSVCTSKKPSSVCPSITWLFIASFNLRPRQCLPRL